MCNDELLHALKDGLRLFCCLVHVSCAAVKLTSGSTFRSRAEKSARYAVGVWFLQVLLSDRPLLVAGRAVLFYLPGSIAQQCPIQARHSAWRGSFVLDCNYILEVTLSGVPDQRFPATESATADSLACCADLAQRLQP